MHVLVGYTLGRERLREETRAENAAAEYCHTLLTVDEIFCNSMFFWDLTNQCCSTEYINTGSRSPINKTHNNIFFHLYTDLYGNALQQKINGCCDTVHYLLCQLFIHIYGCGQTTITLFTGDLL